MVTEIAEIDILPGQETAFEKVIADTADLLRSGEGCHGIRLLRGVEHPGRYRLLIEWESVEHHVRFRETPSFKNWRDQVGPSFAAAPRVEHVEDVLDR